MPLRRAAKDMRDLYANEIARAIHDGHTPDPFSVASWARYEAELNAVQPFNALGDGLDDPEDIAP